MMTIVKRVEYEQTFVCDLCGRTEVRVSRHRRLRRTRKYCSAACRKKACLNRKIVKSNANPAA